MKRLSLIAAAVLLIPTLYAADSSVQDAGQKLQAPQQEAEKTVEPLKDNPPKEQIRSREYENIGQGQGFQQGAQQHDGSGDGRGHD